jgi:aspartokinase
MRLIVKKYGGTSVATATKIKNIAKKVASESKLIKSLLFYLLWEKQQII